MGAGVVTVAAVVAGLLDWHWVVRPRAAKAGRSNSDGLFTIFLGRAQAAFDRGTKVESRAGNKKQKFALSYPSHNWVKGKV